jgi:ribosomal protein S18 acetylase RimI-like enzyme
MKATIRAMAVSDKDEVMRILEDTPEFKRSELVVAEEVIDEYLEDPAGSGYRIVVAELDGKVVGYHAYGPTPLTSGTWDLYWAAISQAVRGRGVGTALVTYAEDQIAEAGGRMALIETSSKPEYELTRRFHRSLGYVEICRIPDFYEPGDDKIVFWKRFA